MRTSLTQALPAILAAAILLGAGLSISVASAQTCRPLALIDTDTGAEIVGAEDIALDREAGVAYVSAYDRWAVEDALSDGAEAIPQGGLYAVPLGDLRSAGASLAVRDLARDFKRSWDFRPHGIALFVEAAGARYLFAVNRVYRRAADGDWVMRPRIERFRLADGALSHLGSGEDASLCTPNDLAAASPSRVLVSNDHGACGGWGRFWENVTGRRGAQVWQVVFGDGEGEAARVSLAAGGIGFANGLALGGGDDPRLYVAATREQAIRVYRLGDLDAGLPTEPVAVYPVEGGPDNLTWAADGRLIAALHPSLFRLGLYRHRWFGVGHAPSTIVALDPASGAAHPLYADESGEAFPAATVAAHWDGLLVLGAVAAPGLLVCDVR